MGLGGGSLWVSRRWQVWGCFAEMWPLDWEGRAGFYLDKTFIAKD